MQFSLGFFASHQPAITAINSTFSALFFLLSLIIALYQISKTRRNQKEATARHIFNDYLNHAIKYPLYSYPISNIGRFDFEKQTIDGSLEKFDQYEWFVSIMIFSMKEILDILSRDRYWEMTAKRQLGYHKTYFIWLRKQPAENNFVVLAGKRVNRAIDEIIGKAPLVQCSTEPPPATTGAKEEE